MRVKIALMYAASLAMLTLVGALGSVTVGVEDAKIKRESGDVEVVNVDCPREDSCAIDYDGQLDRWTVRRVAP